MNIAKFWKYNGRALNVCYDSFLDNPCETSTYRTSGRCSEIDRAVGQLNSTHPSSVGTPKYPTISPRRALTPFRYQGVQYEVAQPQRLHYPASKAPPHVVWSVSPRHRRHCRFRQTRGPRTSEGKRRSHPHPPNDWKLGPGSGPCGPKEPNHN
ncbi:hypothetical protein BDW62DRAFT_90943 [Aspergillus aurantiobrunneus]